MRIAQASYLDNHCGPAAEPPRPLYLGNPALDAGAFGDNDSITHENGRG